MSATRPRAQAWLLVSSYLVSPSITRWDVELKGGCEAGAGSRAVLQGSSQPTEC